MTTTATTTLACRAFCCACSPPISMRVNRRWARTTKASFAAGPDGHFGGPLMISNKARRSLTFSSSPAHRRCQLYNAVAPLPSQSALLLAVFSSLHHSFFPNRSSSLRSRSRTSGSGSEPPGSTARAPAPAPRSASVLYPAFRVPGAFLLASRLAGRKRPADAVRVVAAACLPAPPPQSLRPRCAAGCSAARRVRAVASEQPLRSRLRSPLRAGCGVFTRTAIAKGAILLEYVGETVRPPVRALAHSAGIRSENSASTVVARACCSRRVPFSHDVGVCSFPEQRSLSFLLAHRRAPCRRRWRT